MAHWPGFSLNPGVWDLYRLKNQRLQFDTTSDVFERAFSLQVRRAGLHVAALTTTVATHIGAPPGSNASAAGGVIFQQATMAASASDDKKARKRAASKKYREANKEKLRMRDKTFYASHKARMLAKKKQYKVVNAKKVAVKEKQYRQKHKEVLQAKKKLWNVANRAYRAAYKRAQYDVLVFNRIHVLTF
ncbi:hypothetical protein SDRG_14675 [Saprolegnia diclina VS20]|uniref:Uncharacterized protein n=1 Tax=Saprolegnia diclina (strain VS20) TaxID=1156394 RepID=T0PZE4_SAPDV|nr:hypothetical protein SDRG_14675 [Saprolegnia diclina VS20]EQC27626.1 hypothetical protein SDRG_14675 [Saprolegnia diclina VS20]|eukprot:XP_008619046.1 hypothetical protein SDRG_14675 [Saprolegnia diclina VS20]